MTTPLQRKESLRSVLETQRSYLEYWRVCLDNGMPIGEAIAALRKKLVKEHDGIRGQQLLKLTVGELEAMVKELAWPRDARPSLVEWLREHAVEAASAAQGLRDLGIVSVSEFNSSFRDWVGKNADIKDREGLTVARVTRARVQAGVDIPRLPRGTRVTAKAKPLPKVILPTWQELSGVDISGMPADWKQKCLERAGVLLPEITGVLRTISGTIVETLPQYDPVFIGDLVTRILMGEQDVSQKDLNSIADTRARIVWRDMLAAGKDKL